MWKVPYQPTWSRRRFPGTSLFIRFHLSANRHILFPWNHALTFRWWESRGPIRVSSTPFHQCLLCHWRVLGVCTTERAIYQRKVLVGSCAHDIQNSRCFIQYSLLPVYCYSNTFLFVTGLDSGYNSFKWQDWVYLTPLFAIVQGLQDMKPLAYPIT